MATTEPPTKPKRFSLKRFSTKQKLGAAAAATLIAGGAVAATQPIACSPNLPPVVPGGPITYTVEPADFDGVGGVSMNLTQLVFGGRLCPCMKIPYPADGLHNQQGADMINRVPFKSGDTLLGFSLGVQTISLFMSQHTLPAGVKVVLAGDTLAMNQHFVDLHQGIPWNTGTDVRMIVNEFDGWSDSPTNLASANYLLALSNSSMGTQVLHNYLYADLNHSANVVTHQGNFTAILVPTAHLPLNIFTRLTNPSAADALDATQRPLINTAYSRTASTAEQRAAATSEQVPFPAPPIAPVGEAVFSPSS